MRILDRQRYWAFLKAYLICFVSLVGLYVVIDVNSNFDEFTKRVREAGGGTALLLTTVGQYYAIRVSQFYDQLCGVIAMMAAIFTVTWMQKNSEHVAMLAAGISTQRAIRPVLVSSVVVGLLAVANQELVMPRYADELMRSHADDGSAGVPVTVRYDANGIMLHGRDGYRAEGAVVSFNATLPPAIYGTQRELYAEQATYIPEGHPGAPLGGGWLLRGARLTPDELPADAAAPVLVPVAAERLAEFPPPLASRPLAPDARAYFLRTDVTFASLTRKPNWYQFSPTPELLRALGDATLGATERLALEVHLHNRLLRPPLSLSLMFLSLPLVLGGMGRNMFINLGFSLGNSVLFYTALIMAQYLASNGLLTPAQSAWFPMIGFGTWAAARWDKIRT